MAQPLTTTEKQRIREMLDDNRSHNEISRAIGRSQSTISGYAKREGYSPLPERTPAIANQARREYSKQERLALIGLIFERGEELLNKPDLSAREYKEVVTGIAIGVDKSRLEEGQPNSVHETRSSGGPFVKTINLEEEFARLDQLQEAADAEAEAEE
jgi:hypothetical protein